MGFYAISLNYKSTPLSVREKLTLSLEKQESLLESLRENGLTQAAYLTTCNRSELYGVGDFHDALDILAQEADIPRSMLLAYVFTYEDQRAIRHLLRVTAGMESMVFGEDEILRQSKEAYNFAKEHGMAGHELNMIFQAAFQSAKRIKTETRLSKSSVSVATLAAAGVRKFLRENISNERKGSVLIIGAGGDTGNKVLKDLLSYGDSQIIATEHRRHISNHGVQVIPYEDRYHYINQADVVVSATKSPHYTLSYAMMAPEEYEKKPRLFVDLAVPSDIDSAVQSMEDTNYLTIDAFEAIAAENQQIKLEDRQLAEEILEECLDETCKAVDFQSFLPRLEGSSILADQSLRRFIFHYKDASNKDELRSFLEVLSRMEGER